MTVNQLKSQVTGFFESHGQIRTTIWKDIDKFIAIRDIIYPVVNLEWMESNVDDKIINRVLRVLIADIYNPNIEGIEDEVFSDTEQIAQDFLIWLYNNDTFTYNITTNISKFIDDNGDRTSGVTFQIAISNVMTGGICSTPIK